jgi:PAS domain S-box-containing protein
LQSIHQLLIEQANDAIILVDPAGLVQIWNRGAETLFGYSAEEVLGRAVDIIIPERFRTRHAQGFEQAIRSGALRHTGGVLVTRAQHKEGKRLYVEMSFGLVQQGGAVLGASAIARDCTARFEAEQARSALGAGPSTRQGPSP